MTHALVPTRRGVLLFGAAAAVVRREAAAAAPDAAALLVPGPGDGEAARLAARLADGLVRGLPQATQLGLSVLGGPDGVTAANRFVTTAAPDGRTLLLLPGAAAQARLVGESRAKFDAAAAGWMPVCALAQPVALLVGRGPAVAWRSGGGTTAAAVPPLRVAAAGPGAPETATLLVFDLLGLPAVPVFGLTGAAAEAALAQGAVDAVLATGPGLWARARAIGAEPWAVVEPAAARGGGDPAVAGVATIGELLREAPPALAAACRAALAAARLRATLVLPALTPADIVAAWRRAAAHWQEELGEAPASGGAAARPLAAAEATAAFARLCASAEAAVAYREWLIRRFGWRAA